jgi:hypothetical protein
MATVWRFEVPVDDRWHTLPLTGPVLHVAARHPVVVELWAVLVDQPPTPRQFRVFGTGQQLTADAATYVGTAVTPRLVWHLWERHPSDG